MPHTLRFRLIFCLLYLVSALHAAPDSTYILAFEQPDRRVAVASVPLEGIGLKFGAMDSLLLSDGTYASVNDAFRWYRIRRPAGGFYLETVDGKRLQPHTPSATQSAGLLLADADTANGYWELSPDGHLTGYAHAGAEPRILIFRRTLPISGFTTCTQQELAVPDDIRMAEARIVPAAEKRRIVIPRPGTAMLEGGWSYQKLRTLPWDSIAALDLSHIVLPPWPFSWTERPAACNALIYVSPAQKSLVPHQWKNVVVKGDSLRPGRALTPIALTGAAPVCVPYPFSVGPDSLTFTHTPLADGYWESIYLPFAVTQWPANYLLALADPAPDAADTLRFATAASLPAYTPAIYRYTGTQPPAGPLTLKAPAGTVEATPGEIMAGEGLCGTLQHINVAASSQRIYMLAPSGRQFVPAAPGSYVSPFKCYYAGLSYAPPVRIAIEAVPAAAPATSTGTDEACERFTVYTLQGHCLLRNVSREVVLHKLTPGLYIINGTIRTIK